MVHGVGASLLSAGLVLSAVFFVSGEVGAQVGLALTPTAGRVGDLITSAQTVSNCHTYRLRWREVTGAILDVDSGTDGRGTASFTIPDSPPGIYTVVATCQSPGASEGPVSQAALRVEPEAFPTSLPATTTTTRPTSPTTTTPPGSTVPPTTAPVPSTTSPPPPVVGSPSTTLARPRDIAECESQAREAESQLVYQPNRDMTIGASYDVVVKLALEASDVSDAVLPGPDQTTIVQVRSARCTIEAQLIGVDFEVTPPEPRPQSFLDARVLTWRWQVSPKRTGSDLKLVLRLQPTVVEEGKAPRPGSDDFHEAVIQVDAEPQSLISKVGDGVNGFVGNPLAQLLLIPSGGGAVTLWVRRRYRKRAEARAAQK